MDTEEIHEEETPAPKSKLNQTIIYLICQLFTIVSFASLAFVLTQAVDAKQEHEVSNFNKLITLK